MHRVGVWGGVLRIFHGVVHDVREGSRILDVFGMSCCEDKETVLSDERYLPERNVVERHCDGTSVYKLESEVDALRNAVGDGKVFVGGRERERVRGKVIRCLLWA